jgi:hypothetical protein
MKWHRLQPCVPLKQSRLKPVPHVRDADFGLLATGDGTWLRDYFMILEGRV